MSKEMAESLNLDLSDKKDTAFGIGGEVKSVNSFVKFLISQGHERYSISIPVKVILDDFSFPFLLGRKDFFNEFKITFD